MILVLYVSNASYHMSAGIISLVANSDMSFYHTLSEVGISQKLPVCQIPTVNCMGTLSVRKSSN